MVAGAVVPPNPPSNVFGYRGSPPVPPGGGCAPCTLLGGTEGERILTLLRCRGERFLGCQRVRGRDGRIVPPRARSESPRELRLGQSLSGGFRPRQLAKDGARH